MPISTITGSNPKVPGYRVQVLQDNKREVVREEKTKLLSMYPDLKIYETYDAPFFKLRIGDFQNRFEAFKVFKRIKQDFSRAFIVPDRVFLREVKY